MAEEMVRVYRMDGMMVIGVYGGGKLREPRVVQVSQGPNNQVGVAFLQLIGYPKSIDGYVSAFSYECQDENIVTAYRESVTGLSLAKALPPDLGKVIKMGMTRQ